MVTLIFQLNRTTPLWYLKGELFLLDITCADDDPNQKMMFKYNGTKRLDISGIYFDIIPTIVKELKYQHSKNLICM